jgi:hypothetical protein
MKYASPGVMKTQNIFLIPSILILLLSFQVQATTAHSTPFPRAGQLPPLEELEASVLQHAGLDPKRIQDWQRKSRWSAALPRVQVGLESNFLNQNTNVVQDNISVTSSGVTVGPESTRLDFDNRNNRDLEVRAVWALNELVFNPDQLNISREARDLFFVRTNLLEELHQTYFDLKSLLLQQEAPHFSSDPQWALQVERRMGKLNSLTGGEFGRLLAKISSSGESP